MSKRNRLAEFCRCCLTMISPKLNTKVVFYSKFHRRLDLNHPKTLNEKVLWLKFNTYWDNPVVKQCADKYRVREYLREKGFSELLTPLIGAYDNIEQIPWNALPERFVLKLNIGCGCNLVVADKSKFDIADAKKTMKKWMKSRFWLMFAEMQYKDVEPHILIEEFLGTSTGGCQWTISSIA
ncbi:MAG: ATP-grasp fold amidoligase family protein [Eubacteriales bacterium]|nr:ATP-grasp fold amidoligase family protein [Eubacteriales bacterium]